MNKKESDYKVMLDMIESLKENTEVYTNLVSDQLESKGLSYRILREKLTEYTEDELKEIDIDVLKDIMVAAMKDEAAFNRDYVGLTGTPKYDEYVREAAIDALENINRVIESEKEVEDLKADADNVVKEYASYLTSDKYYEENMKRIAKLKEDLEKEQDPTMKKKIQGMIEALENRYTLQFMFKRLNEMGDKEVERLVTIFFDDNRSRYVMTRYKNKAKALGYNPDIYKYFLNMEEKYLEEKYHVFDNLFLFVVINFIAYIDTYNTRDKMYGQAIINSMANTVYEKFPNEKTKKDFLNIMRQVLDFFENYREEFNEKNYLHPKHPRRIEKDKKREKELREMIYANLGMIDIEINEEIENMSVEELKSFYQDKLDEIENKKEEEKQKNRLRPVFEDSEFEKVQMLPYMQTYEAGNDEIVSVENDAIVRKYIYNTMDVEGSYKVGIYELCNNLDRSVYLVTIVDENGVVVSTYEYAFNHSKEEECVEVEYINKIIDSIRTKFQNAKFATDIEIGEDYVTTITTDKVAGAINELHDTLKTSEEVILPEIVINAMYRTMTKGDDILPKRGLDNKAFMSYIYAMSL